MGNLEKQKLRLESSKEKIRQKERMLREKEKMSVKAITSSLGQLFVKTKTSHLDHEVLFGALLEIAERAQDEQALNSWRMKFEEYAELNKKSYVTANGSRMTISFKSQTSLTPEIKEKLKKISRISKYDLRNMCCGQHALKCLKKKSQLTTCTPVQ